VNREERMREWQQTRFKSICMPDAVYYQSIWAVRDLHRMEERVKEIEENIQSGNIHSTSVAGGRRQDCSRINPTEKTIMEKMRLETRIEAIRKALEDVPPAYQDHILDNVIYKVNPTELPSRVWKVWKQKFLFGVAQNLSLM